MKSENKIKITTVSMARIQLFTYSKGQTSWVSLKNKNSISTLPGLHISLTGTERNDSLSLPEAGSVSLVAAFLKQWCPNRNRSSLAAKCNDSSIQTAENIHAKIPEKTPTTWVKGQWVRGWSTATLQTKNVFLVCYGMLLTKSSGFR